MNEVHFQNLMAFFRKRRNLLMSVAFANKIITYVVFAAYPILLFVLLVSLSDIIVKAILVPLISFIVLSLFRFFYNAKRPYELYNFKPILKVDGKHGKSFPSRHVFSAFIIAFTFLYVNVPLGMIFIVLALILAALRVLCGVHFIKDVLAGMLFALISYIIGFILI